MLTGLLPIRKYKKSKKVSDQPMGIENDSNCSFCRKERDTINHLFWRCACVLQFWEQFQMAINDGCSNMISIILNKNIILFGHDSNFKSSNTFDFISLKAFFFNIYLCQTVKRCPDGPQKQLVSDQHPRLRGSRLTTP